MLGRFMFEPCHMDEVEFHAPPRESKSKRWLSFHPFSGSFMFMYVHLCSFMFIYVHFVALNSAHTLGYANAVLSLTLLSEHGMAGEKWCELQPWWILIENGEMVLIGFKFKWREFQGVEIWSPIPDMMGASFSFFTAAEAVKATDWSVAKPLLDQLMWHWCASLAAFAKLRWFGEHCEASGSPPLPLRWQLYLDKKTKFGPQRKLLWEGWAPVTPVCSACWFSRVCSLTGFVLPKNGLPMQPDAVGELIP